MKKISIIFLFFVATVTLSYSQSFTISPQSGVQKSTQGKFSVDEYGILQYSTNLLTPYNYTLHSFPQKGFRWMADNASLRVGVDTDAGVMYQIGFGSVSMGIDAYASGFYSNAIGEGVIATDYGSTVLGRFNDTSRPITYQGTTLLEIGGGTSSYNRYNYFTMTSRGLSCFGRNLFPQAKVEITQDGIDRGPNSYESSLSITAGPGGHGTLFNYGPSQNTIINGGLEDSYVSLSQGMLQKVGIGITPNPRGAKLQIQGGISVYGGYGIANDGYLWTSSFGTSQGWIGNLQTNVSRSQEGYFEDLFARTIWRPTTPIVSNFMKSINTTETVTKKDSSGVEHYNQSHLIELLLQKNLDLETRLKALENKK